MGRKPLSENIEHVEGKEATVADVPVSATKEEAQKTVSEDMDVLAKKRAEGVRIRFKDSGSVSHVGWKTGQELVNRGRAEYVDD